MKTERRKKERLEYTIPVSVLGSDRSGKDYRFETVARNIGMGGLCAYAPHKIEKGDTLSLRVRFAHPGIKVVQAPELSVRGVVLRTEDRPSGLCMFAVSFLV